MWLSRRSFLSNAAAWSAIPLVLGMRKTFGQTPRRLHALLIGVNTYLGYIANKAPTGIYVRSPIKSLRGCVNDVRGIERAVRPLCASVRVLVDGEVSRASFMNAWKGMLADSAPGDTLLVTYAGHGGQEEGPTKAFTSDGLHDTFIFPTLDSSKAVLNEERILGDEMQALWRSISGRNTAIFVADSCHSGGMTRSVNALVQRDIRYRTTGKYDIDGALGGGVSIPRDQSNLELPHVVFLSGAQHNELVPEIDIEGRPQGALSYAFAAAVAGAADDNKDGIVTGAELSTYVLRTIRTISDSSQHGKVTWPQADVRSGKEIKPNDPLFVLSSSTVRPPAQQPASTQGARLKISNSTDAIRAQISKELAGVTIVADGGSYDLLWDSATRQVVDSLGNIVSSDITQSDLRAVLDAVRVFDEVKRRAVKASLDMRLLLPGESENSPPSRVSDRTHRKGAELALVVRGMKYPYFVTFNITGDGTVQVLYPQKDDPATISATQSWSLRTTVKEPFGADHVIAVNSRVPLPRFLTTLNSLNNIKGANAVLEAFRFIDEASSDTLFAMQGIFTIEQ